MMDNEWINEKLWCQVNNKEVKEDDNCVVSPRCKSCVEVEAYCMQNNNDCETCSLVNYNKDCRNKELFKK